LENVKVAVLLFPGTVVTKRAFKQSAPRKVRGIADSEFVNALESLEKENCGVVLKVHSSKHSSKETIVLVKTKDLPEAVNYVDKNEYYKKYALPLHKAISESTKVQLMEKGLLACD
jgi:CRISPR/Cas system type I-B associated protein Csh2 (Cas7 group RAMP superfamily)